MNDVDTSPDTIQAEFDAAEQAIGIEPDNTPEQPTVDPMADAEREAQIAIAQQMISSTLRLSIGLFADVTLDNKYTEDAAHAYAVLIVKYFPGGLFGLLDRYKEEIAAGTATVMLIRAVSQAKAKQVEETEKAVEAKKPDPASGTGCFTFGESAGESNNG